MNYTERLIQGNGRNYGGMRPALPEELIANNEELLAEGMMFTGEKGKILAGFNTQNPRLFSRNKKPATTTTQAKEQYTNDDMITALSLFAASRKSGQQYPGSFIEAEALTEAINLYAASLRSGHLLKYDAASRQITNLPEANKYLPRQ